MIGLFLFLALSLTKRGALGGGLVWYVQTFVFVQSFMYIHIHTIDTQYKIILIPATPTKKNKLDQRILLGNTCLGPDEVFVVGVPVVVVVLPSKKVVM